MSSRSLQNKPKLDREPAKFLLCDYLARLKNCVADGDQRTFQDLIEKYKICDHFAIRIHAPRVTEHNSDQRDKI